MARVGVGAGRPVRRTLESRARGWSENAQMGSGQKASQDLIGSVGLGGPKTFLRKKGTLREGRRPVVVGWCPCHQRHAHLEQQNVALPGIRVFVDVSTVRIFG